MSCAFLSAAAATATRAIASAWSVAVTLVPSRPDPPGRRGDQCPSRSRRWERRVRTGTRSTRAGSAQVEARRLSGCAAASATTARVGRSLDPAEACVMRWDHARRHTACGLLALALLTSCSATEPRPDVGGSVAEPAPGATLAWSRVIATGTRPFAVVGETVLLADGTALLGLRRSDGGELWRVPFVDGDRFTVAGGHVVVERSRTGSFVASEPTDSRSVEVFDAATGSPRWRAEGPARAVVRTDAVYLTRAADRVTTAHEIADGRPRWTASGIGIANDSIGARLPYAPRSPRYLATTGGGTVAAVDARTGAVQRGRLGSHDWYALVADQTWWRPQRPPAERAPVHGRGHHGQGRRHEPAHHHGLQRQAGRQQLRTRPRRHRQRPVRPRIRHPHRREQRGRASPGAGPRHGGDHLDRGRPGRADRRRRQLPPGAQARRAPATSPLLDFAGGRQVLDGAGTPACRSPRPAGTPR